MRLHTQIPDPRHCWIRYVWRPWPGAPGVWVDLAKRALGSVSKHVWVEPGSASEPLLDVLYLPPVAVDDEERRYSVAEAIAADGTPIVYQVLPGKPRAPESTLAVFDPLEAILTGDLERLSEAPPGATVVWPLLAGYTDNREIWSRSFERLVGSGVKSVLGMALELTATEKRRLVDVGDVDGFEDLFHASPPSEREFASAVGEAGLEPFMVRPLPRGPAPVIGNRKLAEQLCLIGDLWQLLGRSESRGQALFGAARLVDRDRHDITALTRDGNLGVVSWLDGPSREILHEFVHEGQSSLLDELRREFLKGSQTP